MKLMSQVIAGRMVPLLVISPLFVSQVDPTMYPQIVIPATFVSFQNIVN